MITEKAMLAAIHLSIWTAVKHDRKVSRKVAEEHGAFESAGRYNKKLLRGADKLDRLRTLCGQIRQNFYKITLPWSDEGYRLLPGHFYFDWMEQMRKYEAEFEHLVDEFLIVYPQYIERASGTEWPFQPGGLPLDGEAAQEIQHQARGHSHPQRR